MNIPVFKLTQNRENAGPPIGPRSEHAYVPHELSRLFAFLGHSGLG